MSRCGCRGTGSRVGNGWCITTSVSADARAQIEAIDISCFSTPYGVWQSAQPNRSNRAPLVIGPHIKYTSTIGPHCSRRAAGRELTCTRHARLDRICILTTRRMPEVQILVVCPVVATACSDVTSSKIQGEELHDDISRLGR